MNQVRIGIIGAGWWAVRDHIPVLQSREDVRVVGVSRLGREQLQNVQQQFGIEFGTEDYRELLASDELDAVVVSSPHHLHFEHASAALERGLHVMCEKPMVLHAWQARKLAELATARRLHFLIPYGWNYTDFASAARELVGEVGEIEHVHCHMASATRDLFSGEEFWFSRNDPFKPQRETWSDPGGGGGFANGQLTHALGLLFYLTDLRPAEVFALANTSRTGADLTNAISCRFANGATATVGGAGTMPPRSTYQVDLRIFGTGGMLLLDLERPRVELRRQDSTTLLAPPNHEPGAYSCVPPLHVFVDLIQGKAVENRSSAEIGTRVVELLDAAFRSIGSRKVESV